jgi:hypothetical protein
VLSLRLDAHALDRWRNSVQRRPSDVGLGGKMRAGAVRVSVQGLRGPVQDLPGLPIVLAMPGRSPEGHQWIWEPENRLSLY